MSEVYINSKLVNKGENSKELYDSFTKGWTPPFHVEKNNNKARIFKFGVGKIYDVELVENIKTPIERKQNEIN